jgi:hypothetical protein
MSKVSITLSKGETVEDVEEFLTKALHHKHDCTGHERYADNPLNEFHDLICKMHEDVLDRIKDELESEIKRL